MWTIRATPYSLIMCNLFISEDTASILSLNSVKMTSRYTLVVCSGYAHSDMGIGTINLGGIEGDQTPGAPRKSVGSSPSVGDAPLVSRIVSEKAFGVKTYFNIKLYFKITLFFVMDSSASSYATGAFPPSIFGCRRFASFYRIFWFRCVNFN